MNRLEVVGSELRVSGQLRRHILKLRQAERLRSHGLIGGSENSEKIKMVRLVRRQRRRVRESAALLAGGTDTCWKGGHLAELVRALLVAFKKISI